MKNSPVFKSISLIFAFSAFLSAAEIEDGEYDARVTTPSGTYSLPVEVENGEVSCVRWPNGGCMTVEGAELNDEGEAEGTNRRGDTITVEIEE